MAEKEKFEILMEDLKKDFRAAFDGIITLRDEMRRGFNEVKEQIKFVDDKLGFTAKELSGKIDRIEKTLGNKIDRVEQKLDEHMRLPAHVGVG